MCIDSELYLKMLRSGANSVENSREKINALNVFPVPDGDTGSNMSMTMSAVRNDISGDLAAASKSAAGLMLRSARGNSGVILSLFFKGVSKAFQGIDNAGVSDVESALALGTAEAYKAIQNPAEGTILTVMRACSEVRSDGCDVTGLFEKITEAAEVALAKTPEMLPVLKMANVVDAGGAGFVEILKGMTSALKGEAVELAAEQTQAAADFASFDEEDIEFPYCTECIIKKSQEYFGEGGASELRDFVMQAGNSAVFVDDDEIVKIHVHTKDPGAVMSMAIKYGSLQTVKVENMRLQHSHLIEDEETSAAEGQTKYGFVAVTMGDGIKDTFVGLGVDSFVYGGQTMNPSTDQILAAIEKSAGENVFILPNNSNICLVANQAAAMCESKKAIVIPCTSVPQGLAAMLAFDPEAGEQENKDAMISALDNVTTLEMTFAAHDSEFDGQQITKGQILGLVEHKVKHVGKDRFEIMDRFADFMKDASYVTVFYGEGVSDYEAEKMEKRLTEMLGEDTSVTVIEGGQPLYYYLISVEK